MQILGVVIPKLEELQQQGAVGQRKITQYTRYVTIALATLQATGSRRSCSAPAAALAYLRRGVQRADGANPAPTGCGRAAYLDHPDARRRYRGVDVAR